ncbi:SIR2 family protein [Rhodopseudomonas palustris]|uniref:SIR2 family protein n=1 Tax=Rhodopseudomonas palustris TaxID=1076 RepID=UPI0020CDED52|nr:SIR2 family protein [Rhodopseudomonas palustris]MCP9627152.1 SIR2 family protein [Rhodopseudomonas palustris]
MGSLGTHLSSTVGEHLTSSEGKSLWADVQPSLSDALEETLNRIALSTPGRDELITAIRKETASLIAKATAQAEEKISQTATPTKLAPARLLRRLYNGAAQNADCVTVITTNYDTLVECFCDLANLPIDNGFVGFFRRQLRPGSLFRTTYSRSTAPVRNGKQAQFTYQPQRMVRLVKPHGSITWHHTENGPIEILGKFAQHAHAIVVPGPSKYEDSLLNKLFDGLRMEMNSAVERATALLCIGFGFNDVHLQGTIEARLQAGMPAIILSLGLTPNIESALSRHKDLIAISQHETGSAIRIGTDRLLVPQPVWRLDDFLQVFIE